MLVMFGSCEVGSALDCQCNRLLVKKDPRMGSLGCTHRGGGGYFEAMHVKPCRNDPGNMFANGLRRHIPLPNQLVRYPSLKNLVKVWVLVGYACSLRKWSC